MFIAACRYELVYTRFTVTTTVLSVRMMHYKISTIWLKEIS